jgi:hypothetical protein
MRNVQEDLDSIGETLDKLCTTQIIRAGALGNIYAVIDELRAAHGPGERTELAGKISVAILRLELSRRRRDFSAEAAIREDIQDLSNTWAQLNTDDEISCQPDSSWDESWELATAC